MESDDNNTGNDTNGRDECDAFLFFLSLSFFKEKKSGIDNEQHVGKNPVNDNIAFSIKSES